MANTKNIRPGTEAEEDLILYVKDSDGNSMGEIKVPAGHRVPPTRKNAESYVKKN